MSATLAKTFGNYSPDWWTPTEWLEWARLTLGGELFDPCPGDWTPNQSSGLHIEWCEPVYVNHPGDRNGSAQRWCLKYISERQQHIEGRLPLVWCAFNCEQWRYLDPSPWHMPGWMVMPRERIGYIWGGPDVVKDGKVKRKHGERVKSPGNWSHFWTTEPPAQPPVHSVIVRTG